MKTENEVPEYFFYGDTFCTIEELEHEITDLESDTSVEDAIISLPEDWSIEVECTDKEPMFQLDASDLADMLSERFEERFSEDRTEEDTILNALKQCIDFDKLNAMIPKLHYANGTMATITKQYLMEFYHISR